MSTHDPKKLIVLAAIVLPLISGVAYAGPKFARDLTAHWNAPGLGHVLVNHDTNTGGAQFAILRFSSPKLPHDLAPAFSGDIIPAWGTATGFSFQGKAEPFAFRRGDSTCDVTLALGVQGTLLGTLGSREIEASECAVMLRRQCRDSDRNVVLEDLDVTQCSGTWR